jgi:hypothetical protein
MAKEATALDLLEKEDSHMECEDIHRHSKDPVKVIVSVLCL